MEEPRFDPLDYVSVVRRRKWWFVVPVVLSIGIGTALVWMLPRTYQATATIAVSAPRITPTVIGATEIDKQDRMRAVSQQLLSQPVLERTARLEHLDEGGSMDAAVAKLRGAVTVAPADSITPGAATGPSQLSPDQKAQLDTYLVSYVDDTPDLAQRVVNRLVQVFVDENSQSRQVSAQDTSQFIEGQLKASEGRLILPRPLLPGSGKSDIGASVRRVKISSSTLGPLLSSAEMAAYIREQLLRVSTGCA